jgi:hypothetical protein
MLTPLVLRLSQLAFEAHQHHSDIPGVGLGQAQIQQVKHPLLFGCSGLVFLACPTIIFTVWVTVRAVVHTLG